MHAGLIPNGKVVFFYKVENYTQIKLGNGQYAYSAEYDPATNKVVGLSYKVCIPLILGLTGQRQQLVQWLHVHL